ncbi:sel1 repeat family protein [Spongiibacter sp. KMU-158]|uniref:Sel1 repeat family protein n=1 Tax=Spongiibacter pelagi TaxID=2760804 RepID=A0A927GX16_9GAMM|nr:tetratricopeptide repeat protein [Spongiibacter pelagi]MBD2860341.1 sel1 repeat family protein [Spongiibacter pelagi]
MIERGACLPPGGAPIEEIQACAEKGDSEAQAVLIGMYSQGGNGVKPNQQLAAKYTKILAEKGCAQAQAHLGKLYSQGMGVPPSIKESKIWLERSSSNGSAVGKCLLSMIYLNGQDGNPPDHFKAFELIKEASELGDPLCSVQLGVMYFNGQGTRRDLEESKRIIELAVQKGYPFAVETKEMLFP